MGGAGNFGEISQTLGRILHESQSKTKASLPRLELPLLDISAPRALTNNLRLFSIAAKMTWIIPEQVVILISQLLDS